MNDMDTNHAIRILAAEQVEVNHRLDSIEQGLRELRQAISELSRSAEAASEAIVILDAQQASMSALVPHYHPSRFPSRH